jgi:hypothetical protein
MLPETPRFDWYPIEQSTATMICILVSTTVLLLSIGTPGTQACEMLATPKVVCLRPNKAPLGGEAIWDDFSHRNDSSTTIAPPTTHRPSTTVKPDPHAPKRITWWIAVVILCLCTILLVMVSLVIRRFMQRRSYVLDFD